MKITAQDFHGLYAPSECDLRVWLRANNEAEADPGAFEQVLFLLGQRHEQAHLATIGQVADLRTTDFDNRAQQTLALIADGVGVLCQPLLKTSTTIDGVACECIGEPDFLIRENNGYVIRDVKMARSLDGDNHPEVLLQLQFYGWLYRQVLGKPAIRLEAVNGRNEIIVIPDDGGAAMLAQMRKILRLKQQAEAPYAAVGWTKCNACGFHGYCWPKAEAAKDVALVYDVDQGLAVQLHQDGVGSFGQMLERFNEQSLSALRRPWGSRMQKVGKKAGLILRRAQVMQSGQEKLLQRPIIPNSDYYVMFDLEGMPPHLDELDKIYLWGMQVFGKAQGEFTPALAGFGPDGDLQGWNQFLSCADNIFQRYGDIPFVHWHHYERTHISAYITRYGDVRGIADRVLRNLLDLLPIARDSILLPLPSYSLKVIEKYIGFKRTQTEYGGSWSMAKFIEASEIEDEALRREVMDQILVYNREDLEATWAVFEWLRNKG